MGCNQSVEVSLENFDFSLLGTGLVFDKLTDKEVQNIKRSWNAIKDVPEFGMIVMIRLLTEYKILKSVWIFASNLETEEEMRNNSQMKYHAHKLSSMVDKIVRCLDEDLSSVKDEVLALGRKHFGFGVHPSYFRYAYECILYALENVIEDKQIFDPKTKSAWTRLLLHILNLMSTGIVKEEQLHKLNQKKNANKPV